MPWASLRHNYGNASDVPALLRQCAGRDAVTAADALDELFNRIYHQGGWICPAAPATLPFLVDLAHESTVDIRPAVVEFIATMAREAVTLEPHPQWLDAVARQVPRLLALLADTDPAVRREATFLAGRGGLPFSDALDAVWRRWAVEPDRVTRWDLVLAFGGLLAARPDVPDAADLRTALHTLLHDDDLQLRLAAIHALAESEPGVPVAEVTVAVRAVRHPDAAGWQRSAWIGGTRETIVHATGQLVRHDPVAATAFALGVGREGSRDEIIASLAETGTLMQEWRTVTPAVLPMLADRLGHTDVEIRYRSAYLIGCAGRDAVDVADRVAALVDDPAVRDSRHGSTVGDAAVWALARMGDPRCLPGLESRLRGPRLGFDPVAAHFPRMPAFPFWPPGIEETLVPLRDHAERLTRVIAEAPGRAEPWVARVLAAWTDDAQPVDVDRSSLRSTDEWTRVRAARALWRATGDPDPAGPVLLDVAAPLARGECLPVRCAALRYLAEIHAGAGTAPPAVAALAAAVLADPRRLSTYGGWRAFVDDDAVRAAAASMRGASWGDAR